jgi:hypothetical protein
MTIATGFSEQPATVLSVRREGGAPLEEAGRGGLHCPGRRAPPAAELRVVAGLT